MPDSPISSRISRETGSELLIEATIELARSTPIARLTVRDIAAKAGLQTMHLKRYFGSRNGLLLVVTNTLMDRIVTPLIDLPLPQIFPVLQSNDDVALRLRIVSHLLDEGMDPTSFDSDREIYMRIAERIAEVNKVNKRTADTYAFLIQLILQGNHLMGEVNGITNRQRKDIFDLLVVLGAQLHNSETMLGW
jgi:AcrR family transcriptional regulator